MNIKHHLRIAAENNKLQHLHMTDKELESMYIHADMPEFLRLLESWKPKPDSQQKDITELRERVRKLEGWIESFKQGTV